ncbi:hypothetical protein SDC9_99643 [bioreactor metagenome]|uniref:Uncharacterized protein n=1 Tax=bioreactor metagenome TaxID=1076179 RepID=A0A645AI79_9ZZZZ
MGNEKFFIRNVEICISYLYFFVFRIIPCAVEMIVLIVDFDDVPDMSLIIGALGEVSHGKVVLNAEAIQ